jgi:hypothetical protein
MLQPLAQAIGCVIKLTCCLPALSVPRIALGRVLLPGPTLTAGCYARTLITCGLRGGRGALASCWLLLGGLLVFEGVRLLACRRPRQVNDNDGPRRPASPIPLDQSTGIAVPMSVVQASMCLKYLLE